MKAGDPAASPERVVPTERALGGTPEQTPEADSTDDVRGKLQGKGERRASTVEANLDWEFREEKWRGRWIGEGDGPGAYPSTLMTCLANREPGSIETLLAQPHTATSSQHHTATSSQHHTATSSEHHTATPGGSGLARRATRVSAAVVPRNGEPILLIFPPPPYQRASLGRAFA